MSKDWKAFCPPFDTQFSEPTLTDIDNCTEESFCHIFYMLTQIRVSPRVLSSLLHRDGLLTKSGSTFEDCLNYANKYGLVLYDLYPTPPSFTYDQYLTVPPQSILDQAFKIEAKTEFPDLNLSPLWTVTGGVNGGLAHAVAQINEKQFFDSEPGGAIKTFTNPILYQASLTFKLLTQPQMNTFVHKAGTTEYGVEEVTNFTVIYHRAINEDDIKFMAKKFGLDIINSDGTINFTLAKEVSL